MAAITRTFRNEEEVLTCPECKSVEVEVEVEVELDGDLTLILSVTVCCLDCSTIVNL